MADRYVARPRQWWPDGEYDPDQHDAVSAPDLVVDDVREPRFTGLYDASGSPLYRLPEKIGF